MLVSVVSPPNIHNGAWWTFILCRYNVLLLFKQPYVTYLSKLWLCFSQDDKDSEQESAPHLLEKLTRLSVADTSLNDWHLGFHISLVCFFYEVFLGMFCVVRFVGSIIESTPSASKLVSYFSYQFYQNYVHFPQEKAFLARFLNIFLERGIIFTGKLVQILQEVNCISTSDPTFV